MIDPELECRCDRYNNGNFLYKKWCLPGTNIYHNTNGPAIILYYENGNIGREAWCQNGKYHRHDGPAIIFYDINGTIQKEEWWINDVQIKNE